MMKIMSHQIITLAAVLLCVSCGQAPEPAVMTVYHGGNEYSILERGDFDDQGLPAYFVRYHSKDPGNEAILKTERADLYAIIAKHIDTNEHQRVVVIAVEEQGRLFGLMKPREVQKVISAQEVLAYKPKAATKASEEK
jgi:hypothetical protein